MSGVGRFLTLVDWVTKRTVTLNASHVLEVRHADDAGAGCRIIYTNGEKVVVTNPRDDVILLLNAAIKESS